MTQNSTLAKKSDDLFARQRDLTPFGTQTMSKAPDRYVNGVYPKLLTRGMGSHVWDVDDNEYIDWISALGPISVGYCNDYVDNHIKVQMMKGIVFSMPNELEAQVADRLSQIIPSMEMSKFTKTGSDACTMAVKAARAYTGRTSVVVCGYHGWHDWYSIVNDKKAGIPDILAGYTKKGVYNNLDSFKRNMPACIILEPMVVAYPEKGFLEGLRDWCTQNRVVLIFDEVVTGARFEKFAAQEYFGVRPDLTVLSKGIANGMPLAVVGGRREIMKTFERDDFFASTTFGGECLSLAACLATLDILHTQIPEMARKGAIVKMVFDQAFSGSAFCIGYPTRTQFEFPGVPHKALFWQECAKRGILFGYNNFVMAAHTQEDIDRTCNVIEDAAAIVKTFWNDPQSRLEGDLPVEALRLK
jgi:glutamate-1-semialdehyde 2,1-aminomutase